MLRRRAVQHPSCHRRNRSRCSLTQSAMVIGAKPDSRGEAEYGAATKVRSSGCFSMNLNIPPIRLPAPWPSAASSPRGRL